MRYLLLLVLGLSVLGCGSTAKKQREKIVADLPDLKDLADSLNLADRVALKWALNDGRVIHAQPTSVDWLKEFESVLKDSINDVRYRDSYTVEDTHVGLKRTVTFSAKSASQEVQSLRVVMYPGRILEYSVERSRSTFFSSSYTSFQFNRGDYTLSTDQQISGVFDQKQFVAGKAIVGGQLWRGVLDLKGARLPFQFILSGDDKGLTVINGKEHIGFNESLVVGDSVYMASDYFNTRFEFVYLNDSTIAGRWINHHYDNPRILEFQASKNVPYRFKAIERPAVDVSGKHKAVFMDESGVIEDSTILVLRQNNHLVEGSFLTETGDYRFLEGVVRNDSLYLSTMDGSHAFLFSARIAGDSLMGVFRSGSHWKQNWAANLNEQHELSDPSTLTKPVGRGGVDFVFPDETGHLVSLSDPEFENKPVVISVMGTWCPNCLDEAFFLKEMRDEFAGTDLRFIALDFELISDSAQANRNIQKFKSSVGVDFPVLLASLKSTKTKAGEALPFLSGISSYPTMVVLDRNHEILKIHTGFTGPATGAVYDDFYKEYSALFKRLL